MVKTYFGTNFIVTKHDSLDGKTTISYTEQSKEAAPFTVKVTKSGMRFEGKLVQEIVTERDLQDFAKLVSDVWVEHRKLAPKISTSLSEH